MPQTNRKKLNINWSDRWKSRQQKIVLHNEMLILTVEAFFLNSKHMKGKHYGVKAVNRFDHEQRKSLVSIGN